MIHEKIRDFSNPILGHNNTYQTFGIALQLSRNVNCYVWNYFIPVFGMSLTGSISFIITPEAVPGRIGLLITLQLVLIQIFQTVQVRHFNFKVIDLLSRHTIGIETFSVIFKLCFLF